MTGTDTDRVVSPVDYTILRGVVAGVIGTIVYTIFVEAINVLVNGMGAFYVPFRQIAAIALGPQALEPSYDLTTAILAGSAIHFAVGAVFGAVLAVLAQLFRIGNGAAVVLLGAVLGLALYALNVFVIFPAAFPWFLANDRVVQSVGHALFGSATGARLARR